MIYIALGANLPSQFGTPSETLARAVKALEANGVKVLQRSSIWLTAPVPFDPDIPDYHNGVIAVEAKLSAHDLLQMMLDIETEFGRVRSVKNAPRLLDLDLIAYHDEIIKDADRLIVPHPRMDKRAFVLEPLFEISENWTHPVSGHSIMMLLRELPQGQVAKILDGVRL